MEDNTIKDLVSDMLSNIVLGDKPEEEQVKSTGLMSSLPGVRTPTQTQQQEQEAAPKARDKVKEFILRLSDEAEDTNSLRYSEKDAPEITDVMVDSETLLNRYATPLYVYARNLRDYNPERSTIKVRNRGDHSERFLDQMYELARQSSEEAALARMEMGITESLPRSAPRMGFDVQGLIDAVNKDMTLRVDTEELDDEEVVTLSDTDIDTDDADGGAAPSEGKGLMSPRLDEGDAILPPPSVFINSKGSDAGEAERKLYRDAYQEGLSGDELKAFMAQVAHESSSFSRTREGRYTYKGARNQPKWPERMDAAGLTSDATGDEIFNAVYANINGNGDYQSGDGSRYAGRGYIQLTGKNNYRIIGEDIGEDLVGNPDLMLDPVIARKASIAWWKRNVRGNVPNDDYTDVRAVSGLVNRGRADRVASGLDDRRKKFNIYSQEKIPNVTVSLRPRSRPEEDELEVASN